MSGCRRCETALAHCHGTLVRHDDGSWECSDPARPDQDGPPCTGNAAEHEFVVDCGREWPGCCRDTPARGDRPAAGVA